MDFLRSIAYSGFILLLLFSCNNTSQDENDVEFKENKEIMQIIPSKPVKIKLKRYSGDKYSWELTGDNVEEIIRINKKLQEDIKSYIAKED